MPNMRAVGYRQVWDYLEGRYDERWGKKALPRRDSWPSASSRG